MNPLFEELTPWLDRAYALNSALVLMEWDAETEAPVDAEEMNSKAIGILSTAYYNTIINDTVKDLLQCHL
jgi:carboxypeptidase Taq